MFKALSAILVICCVFVAAVSAEAQQQFPRKLKIGIASPLSGEGAWMGQNLKAGIDLYFQENPAANDRLEVFYEDVSVVASAKNVAAVKSMVEVKGVDVLMLFSSSLTYAVTPMIERLGIPTIAITGSDTAKERKYIVKLWLSPRQEAMQHAGEIKKHESWERVAFITTETDSMLDRTKVAKQVFKESKLDLEVVFEESVANVDSFNILATKIAQKNPDVIIINMLPGQPGLFAKKLRERRFSGQIMGCSTIAEQSEIALAQGALSGTLYIDHDYNPSFLAAFTRQYGGRPGIGVANGHDAVAIIDYALQQAGEIDHNQLNKYIRVKDFSGALGTFSFMEDEHNTFSIKATMRRID